MGLITLVQLARIHFHMQISRWTMQKGFQSLNVVICIFRAASLFAYGQLHDDSGDAVATVIIDFTSLLFFSTYTLLVLFWADIVHLAMERKELCTPLTRFVVFNVGGYVSAALFWSLCAYDETLTAGRRASAILIAVLDVLAALAFGRYGHKLLKLLTFSSSRTAVLVNKIREVSLVTVVSVVCFVWKAGIEVMSTAREEGLTYSENGFLDVMFYVCTELLVMGSVLALLSRLPRIPPHASDQAAAPSEGPSSRFYDPYQDSAHETPLIPHHSIDY